MKTKFETQTCSRCQGSGKYSFCERYADRCFKCAGSGVTYSKRGAAARAYYEKLCTIPASQAVIGDRIAASGITKGGALYSCVGTITEIKSRECTKTTVKTLRADGILAVSYKLEYSETEGFSVLGGSGTTSERCLDPSAVETGTFVEKYTEYTFKLTTKYGDTSSTQDTVRVYPVDASAKVAEALTYQETLTKTGTVRKIKEKR
jgi:hypothetical protein